MNVFVCIATTLNGLITAGVPHEEWISHASWESYLERLKTTDVAIVGSKTYKVMGGEEFPENLKYVVLTHEQDIKLRKNVTASNDPPSTLIQKLADQGYSNVGIFGGSEVISSYIESGLVDELFIDIESIFSGLGKNLITPSTGVHKYELIDVKRLDAGAAQLHFRKSHSK